MSCWGCAAATRGHRGALEEEGGLQESSAGAGESSPFPAQFLEAAAGGALKIATRMMSEKMQFF